MSKVVKQGCEEVKVANTNSSTKNKNNIKKSGLGYRLTGSNKYTNRKKRH
jgi:hypothetical protein